MATRYVLPLEELRMTDVARVGGKNASLGELISQLAAAGVRVRRVFASLYNDRAIAYRVHKGFAHAEVSISAGVQRMVRSDRGAAGVMFTMDTESGFREVVFITSSYGLGEMVVQGAVNPDEFYVSKLCLANGKQAILRRGLGTKAIKLVFAAEAKAGASVGEVEVPAKERDRF